MTDYYRCNEWQYTRDLNPGRTVISQIHYMMTEVSSSELQSTEPCKIKVKAQI